MLTKVNDLTGEVIRECFKAKKNVVNRAIPDGGLKNQEVC